MSTTTKPLLVLGATGKQGRKLIDTLLSSPSKDSFQIIALTRNPESTSAKALLAIHPSLIFITGNQDDIPAVFKAALGATNNAPIWGVFSVQQAIGDGATQERETTQGKAMVDGAIANGVKVFVYTSVDRGGDKSDDNPTYVPHFISKYHIEAHLKEKAAGTEMTWTILRPVAFMDQMTPDFGGKLMATWIKTALRPERKLSMIATSDIGYFAAQGFLQPENPDYKKRAISLAGDALTFRELDAVFREKVGYAVPTTFEFLAGFIMWWVTELNIMFRWFEEEGYVVDVQALRKLHPGLMGFGDWLEKEGKFPLKR